MFLNWKARTDERGRGRRKGIIIKNDARIKFGQGQSRWPLLRPLVVHMGEGERGREREREREGEREGERAIAGAETRFT